MDLLEAKSRIAEALVESIFRRARYRVDRFHTEQFPLRFGREDFSPDFRASLETGTGEPFELLLEVKYRPHIDQFISVENQRGDRSVFLMARRQWPKLYFVLVTEHPEPGRSCFQVISFAEYQRSEEHTSELQSRVDLVCRLLLEKKKKKRRQYLHEA